MATANEFVKLAASQIGTTEKPAGSNKIKYWNWYDKSMQGQPWCDCFVSWCAMKVGASSIVGKYAYCPYHVAFAKRKGKWLDRGEKPKKGDIVFFASRGTACHVGIVEKRISASQVQTIEGNTSLSSNDNGGAVMRRTRAYGNVGSSWYILGFFRPGWDAAKKSETKKDTAGKKTLTTGLYKTTEKLAVRKKWSKASLKLRKSQLTANAQANSDKDGNLLEGTKVTVSEVKQKTNGSTWGKIPSGWILMRTKKADYVKKA